MPYDDYKDEAQMRDYRLSLRKSVLWDAACRLVLMSGYNDYSAIRAAELRQQQEQEAQSEAHGRDGLEDTYTVYLEPLPYDPRDAINHKNVHGAFWRLCHEEGIDARNWSPY